MHPSALELLAGGKKAIRVRARRENFGGPVTVRFEGLPAGVTIPNVSIAADSSEATAEAMAGTDAAEATKAIRVVGTAEQVESRAKITLAVKRPAPPTEPKSETKVEPKPEPAPAGRPEPKTEAKIEAKPEMKAEPKPEPHPEVTLDVTPPGDVVVPPGAVRYAEVRVTAKGLPSVDTEPDIKLEGLANDRVKCEAWSASAKADPALFTRAYAVRAAADAPAGKNEVRVVVSLAGVTAAGKFKITIKPEPKP